MWDFVVTLSGRSPVSFRRTIKPITNASDPPNPVNATVFLDEPPGKGKVKFKVHIEGTERDKYPDSGSMDGNIEFDLSKKEPKPERIELIVFESGPKGKTKKKGALLFIFTAMLVEVKDTCTVKDPINAKPIPLNDLSAASINAADAGKNVVSFGRTLVEKKDVNIQGCVYQAGNDWKVRPQLAEVKVHTGVNTLIIRDIVFPDSPNEMPPDPNKVQCPTVDDAIKDLMYVLKNSAQQASNGSYTEGDAVVDAFQIPRQPPAMGSMYWMSKKAVEDHEAVHQQLRSDQIKRTWPNISEAINAYVLGEVDKLSEADANKAKDKVIDEQIIRWSELLQEYIPHQAAYDAGDAVLNALLTQAMAFKVKCTTPK